MLYQRATLFRTMANSALEVTMKTKSAVILGLGLLAIAGSASSAVVTFGNTSTGTSYTEAGMTITATSPEPVRVASGRWSLDCCDSGPETFEFTTGGIFDLLSIFRGHVDGTDPVVFRGYYNNAEIVSTSFNSGQGTVFNFLGFTGLDRVTMSVSGSFTDPWFDDLTFEASRAVPEPASLAILGLGLAAVGFGRRKREQKNG